MKEVSCKVIAPLIRDAEKQRLPVNRFTDGMPYSLAHLRSGKERIAWHEFMRVMQNARAFWPHDDSIVELGRRIVISPIMAPLTIVARMLFSAKEVYFWVNKGPNQGAGNLLFTNILPACRETGPNRLEIELLVHDGYPVCREFLLLSKGGFIAVPQVLGLSPARVEMEELPSGARYQVQYPSGGGWLRRFFRLFAWPFTARAVARQLMDANQVLEARYQELDEARKVLALQATQLRTANSISQAIMGDLDLDRTSLTVVQLLVEVAGFAGAEARIATSVETEKVERSVRFGAPVDGCEPMRLQLAGKGQAIGELLLWLKDESERAERMELMKSLVPSVAIALDNALAYHALADYRKNLERKVEQRTVELRDAMQSRDRIFANINHEIRTPLTLVLLATESVMRREGDLSSKSRLEMAGVSDSARKLLRLVDELLLLAAGQAQRLTPDCVLCDLGELLERATAIWTPAAASRGLKLSAQLAAGCLAHVDEALFERVIGNLLSNAVKFTPSGGSIQVSLGRRNGQLRIEVRDTGIGIDDALYSRLFERFEKGHRAVNAHGGGSGIGLSLVRELVQAHGGAVGVERPTSGGSIFFVTLPAAQAEAAPASKAPAHPLGPVDFGLQLSPTQPVTMYEASSPPAGLILVAEDDPALAAAIANALTDEFNVLVAHDGIEALRLAELHKPDLLVSDVGMPGMDGLEVSRRFCSLPQNRLAPVLLVSARADVADRLAGFDAGAIDYILKPFNPAELRARVHSQLRLRRLALKLNESEKLAALGTMASGLAHEIRNPANAVVNALPPLVEQLPPELTSPESGTGQLLGVLSDASRQIAMLSRQLLGHTRAGQLELESVPLPEVVARALTIIRPALGTIELRQRLDYAGPVRCAPPLMWQVFTNLIENAAHAAGPKGWIEIASYVENEACVVDVADSGPGVQPELRERIFEPFFTTKPPGKGTGLGLTTAREIARRHGGNLDVRPATRGTRFRLEIPIPGG